MTCPICRTTATTPLRVFGTHIECPLCLEDTHDNCALIPCGHTVCRKCSHLVGRGRPHEGEEDAWGSIWSVARTYARRDGIDSVVRINFLPFIEQRGYVVHDHYELFRDEGRLDFSMTYGLKEAIRTIVSEGLASGSFHTLGRALRLAEMVEGMPAGSVRRGAATR